MSHHQLNARDLICPMPVIRVQEKIDGLAAGDILEVTCTDPGALHDIPAWCRIHGHKLVETHTIDREHIVTIQVGDSGA